VDESERSFIFRDVFPSVSLLIRIEVCTLREPLYSINGLVFSDVCVVLLVSNLVTYPYPSCSGTTESSVFSTYKLISYYTNSTNLLKIPCSVTPTLPNILTSVLSFLVRLCVVYFVTPLNNPHKLSPLPCNSPFKSI
jgi:hypothetical protein